MTASESKNGLFPKIKGQKKKPITKKKHYEWALGKEPPPIEEHSIIKHKILKEYLIYYLEIVTQNPRITELPLVLVDGFSGGGQYSYKSKIVYGSPIIMLDAVQEAEIKINLARDEKKISNRLKIYPHFFFIEKDKNVFDYLKNLLKESLIILTNTH